MDLESVTWLNPEFDERRTDMASNVPSGEKFSCVACGADFDRESAVSECRVCHRSYCEECIDEQGLCVPCGES